MWVHRAQIVKVTLGLIGGELGESRGRSLRGIRFEPKTIAALGLPV